MKILWKEDKFDEINIKISFVKENDPFSKRLKEYKNIGLFEGKSGQVIMDLKDGVMNYYIGLGNEVDIDSFSLKKAFDKGFKKIKLTGNICIDLDIDFGIERDAALIILTEMLILSTYKFDYFKSDKKDIDNLNLLFIGYDDREKQIIEEGISVGEACNINRYLVDMPANVMTPLRLGKEVSDLGDENGFEVTLYDETQISDMGMTAFLAVSSASINSPCFMVMKYCHPDMVTKPSVGLVGKGLCYDAGGLSIKPTTSMVNMKTDMGGAAAVIGTMVALAKQKAKVNVVSVVAACENLISGKGYRPGDIIKSKGGKTIFVGNTDAEGRLTLIDAMSYIIDEEKVSKVVDVATLTGAAIHCTGNVATPCISNNDDFFRKLEKNGEKNGERYFRLPIYPEYKEQIKHGLADLNNQAGHPGTITAGLFVGAYVKEDMPWLHLDIAGTCSKTKAMPKPVEVATGVATATLYSLVKEVAI